jgi:hypothetical protein
MHALTAALPPALLSVLASRRRSPPGGLRRSSPPPPSTPSRALLQEYSKNYDLLSLKQKHHVIGMYVQELRHRAT